MTFHISVAASALHGWPPGEWGVSGLPFGYHYFAHLHMAAISQVSGLHLPLIVFRLYDVPLTALLVLQVALAGRLLGGRAWAAPVTVALFLLVREIDLTIGDDFPFGGIGMYPPLGESQPAAWDDPVRPGSLVLACCSTTDCSARAPRLGVRAALWIVLALLLIGDGGAKSAILPMLIGGLVVYLAWSRCRARFDRNGWRRWRSAPCSCRLLPALIRGTPTACGSTLRPPSRRCSASSACTTSGPAGPRPIGYWILAMSAGTLMYFGAPLLGLIWSCDDHAPRSSRRRPLLSLLLVGVARLPLSLDDFLSRPTSRCSA